MPSSPVQLGSSLSLLSRGAVDRSQSARDSFASVLSRARPDATKTPEQAAREGAEQFVAIALIQPLLKQLREANAAAPPFAPSAGEKQFQSLFDNQVARQIASATHFPVVDRIAHDLLKRGRAAAPNAQVDDKKVQLTGVATPAEAPSIKQEAMHAPSQSEVTSNSDRSRPVTEPRPGRRGA